MVGTLDGRFRAIFGHVGPFSGDFGDFSIVLAVFGAHLVVIGRLNCCCTTDFDLQFVVILWWDVHA
jgi:hypothetical protein